ncbi:hypothetical protein WMF31_37695 [Sorangium sp. So ce1036]|uniref:hypothetical protein n=1 Tax=Sorangium sp. So ce1036 TaxID=3133328 RepID=UPI003EFF0728
MTPRARAKELAALAERVRQLADSTNKSEALRCTGSISCLKKEQARKFRRNLRPLWAYDTDRLCQGCRAHWHITMASVELDALAGAAVERARPARPRRAP